MTPPSIASLLPPPSEVPQPRLKGLTFRRPTEILSMTFPPSNSYLGDKIVAPGQSTTIVGVGGIGKTRFVLQMMAAQIVGRPFLIFPTAGEGTRWMLFQLENNNERLQHDLAHIRRWVGEEGMERVDRQLLIHTLEHDGDWNMLLDDPTVLFHAEEELLAFDPHGVVFDPVGEFSPGDLNRDQDMRSLCRAMTKLSRKGNPERAIIAVHHALTGKAGVVKATGYDRTGFGRNSKVLHSWTRAQINIAPGCSEDNSVLVVSCGKCSNGKEFTRFAARLNPETMIYEVFPEFDWEDWQQEVTGKPTEVSDGPSPELAHQVCTEPMTKKELARRFMEAARCRKTAAYHHIRKAADEGLLHWNEETGVYSAGPSQQIEEDE